MAKASIGPIVAAINKLPAITRPRVLTTFFGTVVKFAGTARIRVDLLTENRAELSVKNRRRVQNHIGSVHAAAIALLAESATGYLVGMSVPADRVPVIKSLKVEYIKRSFGDMRAVATLTNADLEKIRTLTKGEVTVPVVITDGKGVESVRCEMIWAWVSVRREPS